MLSIWTSLNLLFGKEFMTKHTDSCQPAESGQTVTSAKTLLLVRGFLQPRGLGYLIMVVKLYPNKPWFLRVYSTCLL